MFNKGKGDVVEEVKDKKDSVGNVDLNERQIQTIESIVQQMQERLKKIEEQKQSEENVVKMEASNLLNVAIEMLVSEKELEGKWTLSKDRKKLIKQG